MVSEDILRVTDLVGAPFCVSSSDGQKVFEKICEHLLAKAPLVLSFSGVTALNSAFLNAAIGQLYGKFPEIVVQQGLRVSDIPPDDETLLKRVVASAKSYFADPARFSNIRRESLGIEDGS